MALNLTGELIESCSCNTLCPCWYGPQELMKMDQGWCDSALLFRVASGESNGVDLAGADVVVATDFPGPTLYDGEGTGRLHIADTASADQVQELEAVFQGKRGGPMEILAGLISTWLESSVCAIDVQDDGDELTARVGDAGEIRSGVLRNDGGDAVTFQNAGFAVAFNFQGATGKIAPSGTQWTDPEMPRSFETHSGVRGSWTWEVA